MSCARRSSPVAPSARMGGSSVKPCAARSRATRPPSWSMDTSSGRPATRFSSATSAATCPALSTFRANRMTPYTPRRMSSITSREGVVPWNPTANSPATSRSRFAIRHSVSREEHAFREEGGEAEDEQDRPERDVVVAGGRVAREPRVARASEVRGELLRVEAGRVALAWIREHGEGEARIEVRLSPLLHLDLPQPRPPRDEGRRPTLLPLQRDRGLLGPVGGDDRDQSLPLG